MVSIPPAASYPHRRRLLPVVMAVCLLLAGAPGGRAAAADAFVPGTGDVPLMTGLSVESEAAVLFDQPDGRIAEAVAEGPAAAAAVRRFYVETLPQLGWRLAGPEIWERDRERLEVKITEGGGRTRVRFLLSPRGAQAP